MNMLQKLIPVLLVPVLSIGVAFAGDKDKSASADATFSSLDRDTDERLSKSEVARDKMLTEHFVAVDTDGDGYLTKREYTAHMKEMKAKSPEKDY